jgi:putative toxin-antitoxin system antitoxin component (TIGR02293 family)
MVHANEITSLLGGTRVLGRRPANDFAYIEMIREGLPFASVTASGKALGLSEEQVLTAIGIPKRTAARRKATKGRLTATESERILRLTRAIVAATESLGDRDNAARWLTGPVLALGGVTPLSLLDTDVGLEQVLTILGRIEYGIFS